MPVFSPSGSGGATAGTVDDAPRKGRIPRQFAFQANKGVPRFEDLLSLRVLERSPTISLPLNTIRTQTTTPDWGVRPTVDDPTTAHEEAADEIEAFFDGNFNANGQTLENLLKLLVTDLMSPDTGTLELVPTESAVFDDGSSALAEVYHLDGITMTKELDKHGVVPEPPQPAYYQFAPRSAISQRWEDVLDALGSQRTSSILRAYGRQQHKPIPFSRDQVLWLERNPQSATNYGFGKVQQVRKWAEILLNVDLSNNQYFSDNEIPQGIMAIASGSETELRRNRQYMRDTIKGETDHVAPMFDAQPDQIDWIPIQGTPEELQFLDSQQWYHKLVWFIFGLNQGEIGDFEGGNRSMGEYHARQVFRQTTKPLIDDIAAAFNSEILPKMEAYQRVDGEIEFYADLQHEQIQALQRERQSEDLAQGLTTPNEIRTERGKDPVPWGDMPPELRNALARKHPEWAAEQWADIDPDDLPDAGLGDLDLLANSGRAGSSASAAAVDGQGDAADHGDVGDDQEGEEGNWTPPATRADDAGEVEDEFDLAGLIRELESESQRLIEDALADVQDALDAQWPEDGSDNALTIDADGLAEVDVADALVPAVIEANTGAMEAAAEEEAERLESELEERYGTPPEVAQVSISFDVVDSFAFEAMRRRVQRNAIEIEDTVKSRVRNVLLDAADEGASLDEVQEMLEAQDIPRERARTIARTEVPQASREGSQALAESTDVVEGKEWDATGDSRTRPWHDAMDGVIVEVDDAWQVPAGWQGKPHYQPADYPRAAHVVGEDQPYNCLLPDNEVRGTVEGALKVPYSGPAREIVTASGRRLTVTPNHPILTVDGFVPAGEVKKSLNLVAYRPGLDVLGPDSDDENGPVPIQQVFDLLSVAGVGLDDLSDDDLHGDAVFREGQVEIATTDSLLPHRLGPARGQFLKQEGLLGTHADSKGLFATFGACSKLGFGNVAGSSGIPSVGELGLNGVSTLALETLPLGFLSLGLSPKFDTAFPKRTLEPASTNAGFVRELVEAVPTLVSADESFDAVDGLSSPSALAPSDCDVMLGEAAAEGAPADRSVLGNGAQTFPGFVAFDQVVEVRDFDFSGHVYDLQTTKGYYSAEGIVVSNCRCAQRSVLDDDLPDDLTALDDRQGVDVDLQLSERQYAVWQEHALDGESLTELLERLDAEHSRTQLVDELGISKTTLYQWFSEVGVR